MHSPENAVERDDVDDRVDDALERVAHGAAVSIPSTLLAQGLEFAFTLLLTNGFGAAAYGGYVLARRIQQLLSNVALGFRAGLSRFLPNAESDEQRDHVITVATLLMVSTATVFGVGIYVTAPTVASSAGNGAEFERFLRIFAVGLPVGVWLSSTVEVMRGLESVVSFNFVTSVAMPTVQLLVAAVGVVVLDSLVLTAVGLVLATAVIGVGAFALLARESGVRPRIRPPATGDLWRRYLRFSVQQFFNSLVTTIQRFGFYPIIALYLSNTAGSVFAVGMLVGSLVRLPLIGVNQFVQPVAASLHDEGHTDALDRLYKSSTRLVLFSVHLLSAPVVVYHDAVMAWFGPGFVEYAHLLVGFVAAQYVSCAIGSVGMLLVMTDNQHVHLAINAFTSAFLVVTAVPLSVAFGLPGLVISFALMLSINNVVEVAALYYYEGYQPFTRSHGELLVAAVASAVTMVATNQAVAFAFDAVPAPAPVVGTLLGAAAYLLVVDYFGLTHTERRLVETMVGRYRPKLSSP